MINDNEELIEALNNAHRVKDQLELENKENSLLLKGIKSLLESQSPKELYEQLFKLLGELIPYETAFVLEQHAPGFMSCSLGTTNDLIGSEWEVDPVLKRAVSGEPCAVYAIERQPAWATHLEQLETPMRSALYCPFNGPELNAILVFCHSEKGFYINSHVQLAEKYRNFTEQTLLSIHAKLQALDSQKLRAEKERTDQFLMQSEKMASLGLLAAGVAHEINNPVSFITSNINYLSVCLKDIEHLKDYFLKLQASALTSSDENLKAQANTIKDWFDNSGIDDTLLDTKDILKDCNDGLGRVREIVSGLRTFARRDDNSEQLVNINSCVNSTLKLVSNELKYHCDLQVNLGDCPDILANEGKINQVLTNLLVNAGHAIKDKGWIKVTTGSHDHSTLGKCSFFSVEDNGCGISPENLDRVFEPFYTSKDIGQGTGLGLAISYSILEKAGGKLEVASELNVGTKFTALIPISKN